MWTELTSSFEYVIYKDINYSCFDEALLDDELWASTTEEVKVESPILHLTATEAHLCQFTPPKTYENLTFIL